MKNVEKITHKIIEKIGSNKDEKYTHNKEDSIIFCYNFILNTNTIKIYRDSVNISLEGEEKIIITYDFVDNLHTTRNAIKIIMLDKPIIKDSFAIAQRKDDIEIQAVYAE